MEDISLERRLRLALREALRARDRVAVSALRSALAAIDNAGAVPAGPAPAVPAASPHFAGTAEGAGAREAERRRLSEAEIEEIVQAEITERQAAAQDYAQSGHDEQSGRLRQEARVLMSALDVRGDR